MATLSVVTIALNEERNIEACLASVHWADELLVVDSGSTDRTVELARKYTDRVITVPWQGYGATKNQALGLVRGDWVLWLDADERVTPELARDIQAVLQAGETPVAAYAMARRAYFLGRWIRHSGWYPARVTRLFRRSAGRFTERNVHEQLVVDGPVAVLGNDLLHFTDPDLHHYFAKFNRYTTLAAEDLDAAGRRWSPADLLLRPWFQFFKMYILRLGFLDGMEGCILAVVSSAYVFVKYAKLRERQRTAHRKVD
jgi:glycosyltransferase involved in cell wall biosynthesis